MAAAQAQHDAAIHSVRSAEAVLQASQMQIRMFQAQVESTLATLKQARIDLAYTRIVSPVDGTVVARQMDVGQTVDASFQAPTIFLIAQDFKKMQVDTNIDESDVGRLKAGQQATFTVDAYPGVVFRGPIIQIPKAPINVQNVVTYDAVVKADNPELKLFPGMTANVSVVTERREGALKVPNGALRFRPANSMIAAGSPSAKSIGENWRVVYIPGHNSMTHPVRIIAGISDGTYTAVEQRDLAPGRQVIVGVEVQSTGCGRCRAVHGAALLIESQVYAQAHRNRPSDKGP